MVGGPQPAIHEGWRTVARPPFNGLIERPELDAVELRPAAGRDLRHRPRQRLIGALPQLLLAADRRLARHLLVQERINPRLGFGADRLHGFGHALLPQQRLGDQVLCGLRQAGGSSSRFVCDRLDAGTDLRRQLGLLFGQVLGRSRRNNAHYGSGACLAAYGWRDLEPPRLAAAVAVDVPRFGGAVDLRPRTVLALAARDDVDHTLQIDGVPFEHDAVGYRRRIDPVRRRHVRRLEGHREPRGKARRHRRRGRQPAHADFYQREFPCLHC